MWMSLDDEDRYSNHFDDEDDEETMKRSNSKENKQGRDKDFSGFN